MGILSPITRPRRLRKFTVYDLEWVPGVLTVRVCGVRDERGYRAYHSVRAFLEAELTSRNRGRWFYAHAGGLADVQFVLDELVQWNLEGRATPYRIHKVKAAFSGSSAIIVKVTRGHNNWYFVDSYWLMRDKLANLAKFLGMKKGGMEDPDETLPDDEWERLMDEKRQWYRDVPLGELTDYNEQDCEILYRGIKQFQDQLLDVGGQLQMTIASCAMHLFRRKYLGRDPKTGLLHPGFEGIPTEQAINEAAKPSYIASRVEVHRRYVRNANYFDINSSFPYSMTFPAPGEYLGASRRLPEDGTLYIVDAEIEVPDMFLPPLPRRMESGRIFFPIGRWRSSFTSVDIELLQRCGGRVLKVYEVMRFASFDDLRAYALDIYEIRRRATDPFEKIVLKYLLNSLYGKFAESSLKISLWIDPDDTTDMDMLFPGAFLSEDEVAVEHAHVPISAFITARSRGFLFDWMDQCYEVFYCDTDGFATTESLSTSDALGGLKLEKQLKEGFFEAPKVYHMMLDEAGDVYQREKQKALAKGDPAPPTVLNKAKGFSRVNTSRWFALAEGAAIPYERMMRIRERWRRGLSNPIEMKIEKKLQTDKAIPKRYTYPDGYTRPYTTTEIEMIEESPGNWIVKHGFKRSAFEKPEGDDDGQDE